jgi:predicted XRE-type DNA-binding protein
MAKLKYSNIFEAIAAGPEEAADLEFRADLMLLLREYFHSINASQAEVGVKLGVPQPRVSELMTGKVHKFSSDKLIGFLAKVGIRFRPTLQAATARTPMKITCGVSVAQL